MNFDHTTAPARHLVGLSIRTSHDDAARDIGAFWGRVMSTGALEGIDEATPGYVHAVYTEMEDEWRGAYTMLLTVEVPEDAPTPAGMQRVVVPAREAAIARIEAATPERVGAAWHHVWYEWDGRSQRAYTTEVETHALATRDVTLEIAMRQAG